MAPRRFGMRTLILLLTAFVLTAPTAKAEQLDAKTLVKRMKEVLEPSQSSLRRVVFTSGFQGYLVPFTCDEARKTFPDGKRTLMVMRMPEYTKGNTYLFWERDRQPNSTLVYVPFLRRVREFLPVEQYQRFLDTDFTYADLGFVRVHEHYRFLGKGEEQGKAAYKVEEDFPGESLYYSRILIWLNTDSFLPLRREYYDTDGNLWKTELFKRVDVIDGVPTPLLIEMKDQDGYSTELNVTQIDYNVTIPDELFDPRRLPNAATHPIWQENRPKVK
jgi:hypothetical protein